MRYGAGSPLRFQKNLSLHDYCTLLEACFRSKFVSHGKLVHQHLLKHSNFKSNHSIDFSMLLAKLAHFYIVCDEVVNACKVFDEIPKKPKSAKLWNMLIRAYSWRGPYTKALDLYYEMLDFGVTPTKFTFPFVLKACSALQAREKGQEIHAHAKILGLDSDVYVSTALVDMYAKCGCLVKAEELFQNMANRDVVAWNCLIAGFSLHGAAYYDQTMKFLVEMQRSVSPTSSTMVSLIPIVAQANDLRVGKAVHAFCLRRGYNNDVVVETGVLDMYGKCRCITSAKRIFDMMGVAKNEVTWSAMIGAYVTNEFLTEALKVFHEIMMLKDGAVIAITEVTLAAVVRACAKLTDLRTGRCLHCYAIKSGLNSDLMLGNTLLSMYAKCGIIKDAVRFFNEMDMKDTVSFGAMISGFMQNGNAEEALQIFRKMLLSGIGPDLATMVSVLPACSHLAAFQRGRCCHCYAIVRGFTAETSVCNALIDMYAKCGRITSARDVFDRMDEQDIVSWNTMIIAYGIHGLGMDALNLFNNMLTQGLEPDDVTFISLLYACSHSGLVAEGKHWFTIMTQYFEITPRIEHYICMTDLLSRAGLFEEVWHLIENMPFEPDVRVWSAVFAACNVYKNIELGEKVSKKIQRLGPESTGNFVLLSNMYSAVGRWDDAAEVRIAQRGLGFKKIPGCSWIEIGGVVHAFVGGDRSHPQSAQINQKLEELLVEIKKLGYCSESSFVLQDVEEEEKEGILLYHSEKLAIAFGILSLSHNKPILVTKNLRVCGDCHIAIKFFSLISKREITVRDASRFHHFKDGICNCRDFW
ncbi:hypothetical protein K2173_022262 [Erythroxylum novogranatense]|uniref:DYW domain-containing protein n=1 Tax=Erythroxylum novogranatense TaxID=1862640 RepID=A0AAV8STP2_9ROSI|nr:hypothetical protein K2173_022262 [Erythroxylum novogranatense]